MSTTPGPDADFFVFFDESGTHDSSALTLAGAVEIGDRPLVDGGVRLLERRALASPHLWQGSEDKKGTFAARGFHYTEDSAGVQGLFVGGFSELPFRASVMFSRRSIDLSTADLLINMYFVMVRNYARKHRGRSLAFVFEKNQLLNDLYARIVAAAIETLPGEQPDHVTYIGSKPSPGLSLVDYLLGIAGARLSYYFDLSRTSHPYKIAHYEAVASRVSHVLDFDSGVHRSKFRDILFERVPPIPST